MSRLKFPSFQINKLYFLTWICTRVVKSFYHLNRSWFTFWNFLFQEGWKSYRIFRTLLIEFNTKTSYISCKISKRIKKLEKISCWTIFPTCDCYRQTSIVTEIEAKQKDDRTTLLPRSQAQKTKILNVMTNMYLLQRNLY